MAWHSHGHSFIHRLQFEHILNVARIETLARLYWGSQHREDSKAHWRKKVEKCPTVSAFMEDKDQRLREGEIRHESLMQRQGMSNFNEIIRRLKASEDGAGVGVALEGYRDEAPKLEEMRTALQAHQLTSIRAYRLFRLVDGAGSSGAAFVAKFCQIIMSKEEFRQSLADVQLGPLARYSNAQIAENESMGRGIANLYRLEAIQLLKTTRKMFEEFNPILAEALTLTYPETDKKTEVAK